ncbi:hypothetical protein HPB51_007541 [Rhipicephalus microplus]|uniref:Uncharacterized protein n=1 Tax=Rhipicephalus microplus TaxID=6941 RepID=A0A9J6ERD8_RHIMP|nr:hypothetical protein HPB51_007541 [Rhipicephalus microplus]
MRTSDNPFVFLVQFFLGLLLTSGGGSLRSGESTTAPAHSLAYYHAPTIPSCTSSEMSPHHSPLPILILTAHDQHPGPPTSSPTKARAAHSTLLGHGGTSGMRTSDNPFVFLVQVSENQPNDAKSVSSNEETRNDARAPSAASLDNKNDDDAGLAFTWMGDGWHTVFSRRIKKNDKQSQKEPEKGPEKKNEKSAGHPLVEAAQNSQVERDFQRRKRPGPTPLPKEDTKVILRPHKDLTVKNIFGSEHSMAVIEACRNSFGGESFLLRVHPGSNIIILSTPHKQMAGRLREINQLKIRGLIHPFNAYVADPEDVLRGIVHGLPLEPLRPS